MVVYAFLTRGELLAREWRRYLCLACAVMEENRLHSKIEKRKHTGDSFILRFTSNLIFSHSVRSNAFEIERCC